MSLMQVPLLQDKSYPRDWLVRGRVRVQLFNDDGKPVNPDIPNSKRSSQDPCTAVMLMVMLWLRQWDT